MSGKHLEFDVMHDRPCLLKWMCYDGFCGTYCLKLSSSFFYCRANNELELLLRR